MGMLDEVLQQRWQASGFGQLTKHVSQFMEKHKYDHVKGGDLPRNYEWRPYRFCVQDVLLGATVVKHARADQCLLVDVFLTADVPQYERGSGAKALAVFLLSEAYKCGGSMEIRFTRNVEGGQVPSSLQYIAKELDVPLQHEGTIVPKEAQKLYLALTEFPSQLEQQLKNLDRKGIVSIERACFVVHHGVWTRSELESILLGSRYPDSILSGTSMPEYRHLFLQDLLHARAAVLGGFLDRRLTKREVLIEGAKATELEDTRRRLEMSFNPTHFAKSYCCNDEPIAVPWLTQNSAVQDPVTPSHHLTVLIRARDAADLRLNLETDLRQAQGLAPRARSNGMTHTVAVLIPHDFHQLSLDQQQAYVRLANDSGVGIMICSESAAALDAEAYRRMARSRSLRQ